MSFFNRKEEVLEIKLTQYGKRLLGTGRFKPEFYAFYDDDILYDTNYGGFSENQNDAHDRIKETPRSHIQHSFDKVETSMASTDGFLNLPMSSINREYSLALSLGESDQGENLPAWEVRFLDGQLSGAIYHTTGSLNKSTLEATTGITRIPQLITEPIKAKTKVVKADELINLGPARGNGLEQECDGLTGQDFFISGESLFPDNTAIELEVDRLILEIDEHNVDGSYENFDIEIFELVGDNEELKPLFFQKAEDQIQDGILVSDLDPKDTSFFGEPTDENVEYYMNVQVDSEIGRRLLCSLMAKDSPDGVHSRRTLNCEDFDDQETVDDSSLYNFPNDSVEEDC